MTDGRFGVHGGQYIPETLMNAVTGTGRGILANIRMIRNSTESLTELLNEYAGQTVTALLRGAHDGGSGRR